MQKKNKKKTESNSFNSFHKEIHFKMLQHNKFLPLSKASKLNQRYRYRDIGLFRISILTTIHEYDFKYHRLFMASSFIYFSQSL